MRNSRERTIKKYNLDLIEETVKEIPELKQADVELSEINELRPFNEILSKEPESDICIHFYLDDYQFERLWNNPAKYIKHISKYRYMLTPDFSLYTDMPIVEQIYNTFRSRVLANYYAEAAHVKIIPTLSWSTEKSYNFCFAGLKEGCTVSVSTVGVVKDKEAKKLFIKGFNEAIERLKPSAIILYGVMIPEIDWSKYNVKQFLPAHCVRARMLHKTERSI